MATYGSTAGVQALVQSVNLTANSTPTLNEVEAWLGEAYAIINRTIATAGYSTPVASSAALYAELTGLENLYAAAQTLRATGIDTASGQTEERSEMWLKDFYNRLKTLVDSNLDAMGATPLPATTPRRRRRFRTMQLRRVDGYSGAHEGGATQYGNVSE